MQIVENLWGTCGVFVLYLWGTCGVSKVWLHLPIISSIDMEIPVTKIPFVA